LTIHEFRRSAARNLRRAHVDKSTAMKITGDKTNSMFKRNAIVDDRELKDAMARVGQHVKATRS